MSFHFQDAYLGIKLPPSDLTEILEKHTFVGIVDLPRSLSLIQYSTKLYLVNHGSLAYVVVHFMFTKLVTEPI